MAKPPKPTKAELAAQLAARVKRATTVRGASVAIDLQAIEPPQPVNGGSRKLLPRNGTAHAPGNIEKVKGG